MFYSCIVYIYIFFGGGGDGVRVYAFYNKNKIHVNFFFYLYIYLKYLVVFSPSSLCRRWQFPLGALLWLGCLARCTRATPAAAASHPHHPARCVRPQAGLVCVCFYVFISIFFFIAVFMLCPCIDYKWATYGAEILVFLFCAPHFVTQCLCFLEFKLFI